MGQSQIGQWTFVDDGPLGVTAGYNGAHNTDPQMFKDIVGCGMTRIRLNVVPDYLLSFDNGNTLLSPSASPSTWNWGFIDQAVTLANQNGIRCTLIARGLKPSKSAWTESTACNASLSNDKFDTTIANYAKMAVAYARRYSGDGNPDNAVEVDVNTGKPIAGGKLLQADCIELGNEEINSQQDNSALPYTGCRNPMRYVNLVRTCIQALRASTASGGGGWVPRGNFQARVGAWGIVHSATAEINSTYGILTHPVLDATYNPSGNSSSIFGFDSVLGFQMLDYANFHNYNPPNGSGGLTPAAECTQIRGILNAAGNSNIPIWCTEAGTVGPCGGTSETAQANYYAANADGSGGGALQALKDAGCQHWDIFTMNYTAGATAAGYVGQVMSIATKTSNSGSPPNSYVQFQAHTRVGNYMTNVDKGAWAAQTAPAGFGGSSSPPPPPPPGPPPPPPLPPMTTVATDTFVRANQSGFGTASDGVDTWANTNETGTPTVTITSNKGKITGSANATGIELLGSLTETDCDAVVRTSTTASGDSTGVVLRSNSGGTVYYRVSLSGGNLLCHYFDGTTQNVLYSHAVTYTAGNNYWIRFRIIGTTLQGRFWASGTTEPNDFTNVAYAFTITDTNLASGKFGVRARVNATSDAILFDSFTASSFGAVSPPPPPPPPPGNTPQLTGAFSPLASQNINLTTEGAGDWAHWGLTTGTTFDHKSAGGSQIANFTTVGNGAAIQNPSALNTFTWTDGTPDSTATATSTGSKINPGASGAAGAFGSAGQASTPHVMVVALENHAYDQSVTSSARYIIGNPNFPHVNTLATTYGLATKFYGVTHQSLPNYLAFASGSDQGDVADTYNPLKSPLAGNTLATSLDGANIAWKHYAEGLPSAGYLGSWSTGGSGDSGTFVAHHCPWIYFKNFRTATTAYQQAHIVNYSNLATDLSGGTAPPFIFVQPDNTDNGHNGGTDSSCDTFVNGLVATVTASTWYTANNGIIILWWDEANPDSDTGHIGDPGSGVVGGGHTVCIVISAQNSNNTLATNLNHYGILHAINNLYGLSPLGKDAHTINGDLTPLLVGNGGVPPPPPGPPPPPPPPPPTTSNLGNGVKLSFPADTNTRTANIYTDVNQGIATLAASLSDGSAPDFYDSTLANKTAASAGQYALTYAAANPNALLNVFYTLSDGTTPGTAKASDTFQRANHSPGLGTASDGETYQLVTEAGSPVWGIMSNQAQLSGSAGDTSVALLGSGTLLDCEAAMLVDLSNLADSAGLVLRAASSAASYYRATLTGSMIVLAYVNAGVSTILNSQPATLKVNTFYWLRFRILKNSLYARYWPNDGTKEPKNWHVFAVDRTIETAGQYGFRGVIGATSDTILLDTYSIVDLSSNNDPSYVSLYAADLPTGIITASGALSVSSSTPSGTIDVTAEGTGDWAHWGYPSATSFDHKASVTQLISNYSNIGSGTYTQNTSALLAWSWEDGLVTPTVVASTTETDVTQVGNGFSFSLPADTNSRQVFVYVSATKAQGKLIASLSDGSATTVTDTSLNDTGTGSVLRYAITYNAGSANQTLTIQWLMLTDNGTGGSLTTYSTDTFVRGNQSGWGTQSDAVNTWTVATGAALPSIVSNKGQITSSTTGAAVVMFSGTGTQSNAEVYARYAPSATSDSLAVIARATSSTTYYKAQLSSAGYTITKVVGGTSTDLATAGTTPTLVAGSKYWLKLRVNGSNLYSRTWADGSSEPTSWNLTAVDSSITGAGQYGLRGRINTSGDTIMVDAFTVTNFGTGGGTPGSIGLDAATVPLLITTGPPPPPPPPQAVNATFTVNASDAVTPNTWQGLGVQQDAYTQGTGAAIAITSDQRNLINERINYMNPPLIRTCADSIAWWCPSGVVGTYDFYNATMLEWYNVFENAQQNNINVIVGVNSAAPFSPLSMNWCTAFAALIDQLVNNSGYTCVKYVSGLSEPDTMSH